MIEGVVNANGEAVVPLLLLGPTGQTRTVRAVIDTGFTRHIALPPALIKELELNLSGVGWATLADGSDINLDIYTVTAIWNGQPRHLDIYEVDTTPLIGMMLLYGSNINIQAIVGGSVHILPMA